MRKTTVQTTVTKTPAKVPNTQKQTQKGPKSTRRGGKKVRRSNSGRTLEQDYFISALTAPSIFGPARIPRKGSARTGLGYDRCAVDLGITASSNVSLLQMGSGYTNFVFNTTSNVATTSTAIGAWATTRSLPDVQFPPAANIADVNFVAGDMVIEYLGNPLNVSGEILVGSALSLASDATFNSLRYYPGTLSIPVASIIENPVRVFARKVSPAADEFFPASQSPPDIDLPFVAVTGIPAGQNIRIHLARSFEYRSTTSSGFVQPYDKVGPSFSSDIAAFENANAEIASMNHTGLSAMLPDLKTVGMPLLTIGGLSTMLGYFGNRAVGHLRNGGINSMINEEAPIPFRQYASQFRDEL